MQSIFRLRQTRNGIAQVALQAIRRRVPRVNGRAACHLQVLLLNRKSPSDLSTLFMSTLARSVGRVPRDGAGSGKAHLAVATDSDRGGDDVSWSCSKSVPNYWFSYGWKRLVNENAYIQL